MADNKIIIEVGVVGDAEVRLKKLTDTVAELGTTGEKSFSKFSGAFDVFAGTLASGTVIGGFQKLTSVAADLFKTLAIDGVRAAIEQEDAINQLNTALVLTGKYSRETSQDLAEFAALMQQTTKYEDNAVLSAAALIQTLGNLSEDGLKKATLAAADLAAGLGKDLNEAATAIGKTAIGETSLLNKYGFELDKTKSNAENLARALEFVNGKWGGTAASQLNTFSGAVSSLSHIFGEVKEEIGFVFIENQSLINVMKELGKIFTEVGGTIHDNRSAMNDLVSHGIVGLIESLQYVVAGVQTSEVVLLKLYKVALLANVGLSAISDKLSFGFTSAGKNAELAAEKILKVDDAIAEIEKGGGALGKLQDGFIRLREAAEKGLGQTSKEAERLAAANKNAALAAEALSAAQKKLIDDGVKLAEQARDKDPEEEFAHRSAALEAAYAKDQLTVQQFVDALFFIEEDHAKKVSELRTQEADDLIAENNRLTQDNLFRNEVEIQANQDKLKKILADESLSAKDRTKIQTAYAAQSRLIENGRAQAIGDSLNALATLQTAKTKELAAIGKAAAIAQATIETYKGATSAASALAGIPFVGPGLAVAAAAAFIAAGLARVGQIVGVPLATGISEVPAGFPNDSFPARLTSGERVVDAGTNRDLKDYLSSRNDMTVLLSAILGRLDNLENQFVVNIGNRTLMDEVREGFRSGRAIDV